MASLNYSRQREAILTYLHSVTSHPTADTIYENVRKKYPKISKGTVYRNLGLLSNTGQILRLTCGDGMERFDGNPKPHAHFICRSCNSVLDIDLKNTDLMKDDALQEFDGEIEGYLAYFYGKCPQCKKK